MGTVFNILTITIAISVLFQANSVKSNGICKHSFMRIDGCYKDQEPRTLPNLILYERSHQEHAIDWVNWKTWLPDFVCRCAELVKERGFKTFAVQFYGECWSGNETFSENYDKYGQVSISSNKYCTNLDFQKCGEYDEYCAGGAWANAVYMLVPEECPSCEIKFKSKGCYNDKEVRALDHLLITDRDASSHNYSGISINWADWNTYIADLACRCARKAADNGFTVFGLQYYGECWAGDGNYTKYGTVGSKCIGKDYQNCGKFERFCTGEQWSHMVYEIVPKCDLYFEKVGCYADQHSHPRPLPDYILSDRESGLNISSNQLIDWRNWDVYLPDLACRCAHKAKAKGFSTFGLQFYGECWSGPKAEMTYYANGKSQKCVNHCGQQCKPFNQLCSGLGHANFVYMLKHPCEVNVKPIGCYKDDIHNRQLRNLILSERDPTSDKFEGNMIDWDNWDAWFPQFLCRCARKAKLGGYQMFGLQFHGECWSDLDAARYNGLGSAASCFKRGNETCTSSEPKVCTGGRESNYVFELLALPDHAASSKRDNIKLIKPVADDVDKQFLKRFQETKPLR